MTTDRSQEEPQRSHKRPLPAKRGQRDRSVGRANTRAIDAGVERAADRALARYEAEQDRRQAEADEVERTREHLELFADAAALPSIDDEGAA